MSERMKLPQRRASESFSVECHGLRYVATISRFADGRVAEVFLQSHKAGSQADANARDAAVAASLCLQFGCPLEVLRRALLRDARGVASSPLGAAIDRLAEQSP